MRRLVEKVKKRLMKGEKRARENKNGENIKKGNKRGRI